MVEMELYLSFTMDVTQAELLLNEVRGTLRLNHYAYRTEESYLQWIRRYILFHQNRHPQEMSEPQVVAFLKYLAEEENVAASTQNQALSALLFLYRSVLQQPLSGSINTLRVRQSKALPTVLTLEEVQQLLRHLEGTHQLLAKLLYGAGMRVKEGLRLRVQDLDFDQGQILVRDAEDNEDRVTVLPRSLAEHLQAHLVQVKQTFNDDLALGYGVVDLPPGVAEKSPNAERQWGWQYVFPAKQRSLDPVTGKVRRYHLDDSGLQRSIKLAAKQAKIPKKVSCHTLRHSFATHLLENGYGIHTVKDLLGHKDVKTTMIYTHLLNPGGLGVRSPLDG